MIEFCLQINPKDEAAAKMRLYPLVPGFANARISHGNAPAAMPGSRSFIVRQLVRALGDETAIDLPQLERVTGCVPRYRLRRPLRVVVIGAPENLSLDERASRIELTAPIMRHSLPPAAEGMQGRNTASVVSVPFYSAGSGCFSRRASACARGAPARSGWTAKARTRGSSDPS